MSCGCEIRKANDFEAVGNEGALGLTAREDGERMPALREVGDLSRLPYPMACLRHLSIMLRPIKATCPLIR